MPPVSNFQAFNACQWALHLGNMARHLLNHIELASNYFKLRRTSSHFVARRQLLINLSGTVSASLNLVKLYGDVMNCVELC